MSSSDTLYNVLTKIGVSPTTYNGLSCRKSELAVNSKCKLEAYCMRL